LSLIFANPSIDIDVHQNFTGRVAKGQQSLDASAGQYFGANYHH